MLDGGRRAMSEESEGKTHILIGMDSDFIYNSLAEILSSQDPISKPEEAFNCASTMGQVLHFLKNVMRGVDLQPEERLTVSEILGALDLLAKRIMEWESRKLGMDELTGADVKYVGYSPDA